MHQLHEVWQQVSVHFLFNVMTLFSFDTISLSTGTINIELKIDCYEISSLICTFNYIQ